MALTEEDLRTAARRLLAEYDAGRPGQLFAERGADWLTFPDAYRLQDAVADLRRARGERCVGWKVGCISTAIQSQFGIQQPVRGRLWEREACPSGTRLLHSRFTNFAVEGEIALRLAPGFTSDEDDPASGVDTWFPVVELHNYVFGSKPPTVQELVAGNAMHAGFVATFPAPHHSLDALVHLRIQVEVDQAEVERASLDAVPGGPLASLRWLAAALAPTGETLRPGDVILTGSPGRLWPVGSGSTVRVTAGSRSVWVATG